MDPLSAVAGALCLAMALGHEVIGLRYVLPHLTEKSVPATPFGPPDLTVGMLRVTWHIVGLLVTALGVGLLVVAADPATSAPDVVVRGVGTTFAAAAVMAYAVAPHPLRNLRRLPVPVVWLVVAVLCWVA